MNWLVDLVVSMFVSDLITWHEDELERLTGKNWEPVKNDPPEPPSIPAGNLWRFYRETGSQQTKLFKLVDKGNGKVGISEEFGYNDELDIWWRVSHGDVVEELDISEYWPGYGLAFSTAPAPSWDYLKYVRLRKIGNDGKEYFKKGLIVKDFNDGIFINLESGDQW